MASMIKTGLLVGQMMVSKRLGRLKPAGLGEVATKRASAAWRAMSSLTPHRRSALPLRGAGRPLTPRTLRVGIDASTHAAYRPF